MKNGNNRFTYYQKYMMNCVYLKSLNNFSIEKCKEFFLEYDMKIEIHPDFDIYTHSGFLAVRLEFTGKDDPFRGQDLITGFDFSREKYNLISDLKAPLTEYGDSLELVLYGLPKKISKILHIGRMASCKYKIKIDGNTELGEAFSRSVAIVFGAYLLKHCKGIFERDDLLFKYKEKKIKSYLAWENELIRLNYDRVIYFDGWTYNTK